LGSMQWKYANDPTCKGYIEPIAGMGEDHPYSPDNPYGATKAAADMLCIGWHKSFDVDVTILRSFNVTGIGQSYDKEGAFIPKVIEDIFNKQNPKIFGAGDQTRDYLWVGDLAQAYYLVSKGDYSGQVFHAGTGIETTIREVAETLIKVSGYNLSIDFVESRPKELKRLKCNWSKIKALGWKPTKGIDQILYEMWQYRITK
jgi:dTDP-glucose 4,6-dehydratase